MPNRLVSVASALATAILIVVVSAAAYAWHLDPWLFSQSVPVGRVAIFDQDWRRNPALLVYPDRVEFLLPKPSACTWDVGSPVPYQEEDKTACFDVHVSGNTDVRNEIVRLVSPFRDYGGSPVTMSFLAQRGFPEFAKKRALPCTSHVITNAVILQWDFDDEIAHATLLEPKCNSRRVDAAIQRVQKAFNIAAEATQMAGDPRSHFSIKDMNQ